MRTAIDQKFLEDHTKRRIFSQTLLTADGKKIFLQRNFPKESQISSELIHLIMVHELSFYHARFAPLVEELTRKMPRELAVTVIDMRGHGLSTGPRAFVDSFQEYVDDLCQAVNLEVPLEQNARKTFLLGEGGGALIVLKAVLENRKNISKPLSGVMLLNPLIKIESSSLGSNRLALLRLAPPKLRPMNLFDLEQTCSHQERYKSVLLDPLNQKLMTSKLLQEIFLCSEEMRPLAYYLDLPSLFLLAEEDKICAADSGLLFAKGIDSKLREIKLYSDEGHNILWGKKGSELALDMGQWMRRIG